jgi:membrane protein YqaA with SNARE-associated domain
MAAESAHPPHERDTLLTSAAEAVAERAHSPFDRSVLRATAWFAEHTVIRAVVVGVLLLGALIPGLTFLLLPGLTDDLKGFGYASVFLMNLASTATFYVPVPGLTAAAQTLIATEGNDARFPWLVGVLGGVGMSLGEITAYYAGLLGAELVRGRDLPGPKRFHATIERVTRAIVRLMNNYGMATLFVLSAVPNPLFEIAGLTAGSVRMQFRRFIVSVTGGKIVRGLLLAYYGEDVFKTLVDIFPFG